jgi:hypothetical protein
MSAARKGALRLLELLPAPPAKHVATDTQIPGGFGIRVSLLYNQVHRFHFKLCSVCSPLFIDQLNTSFSSF